MAMLDG